MAGEDTGGTDSQNNQRDQQHGNPSGAGARHWERHHRHDRCDCPPHHHCGHCGPPPYWDPWCDPSPYRWGHHRQHWRKPPTPGTDFFEAMLDIAASTAGSRGYWWRQMAEAARYARRDFAYGDPCYEPWPSRYSHCDPCEPPWRRWEPCPPKDWYDPCAPSSDCCDPCAEPGEIDLKELKQILEKGEADRLQQMHDDGSSDEDVRKEKERIDGWIDQILHVVRLARTAEAMRQKKWSRRRPW